ncbi:MAG: hypothetical protein [Microviridae sp.]|nr:MAG: hypothetical protein [Microviridae sp.]
MSIISFLLSCVKCFSVKDGLFYSVFFHLKIFLFINRRPCARVVRPPYASRRGASAVHSRLWRLCAGSAGLRPSRTAMCRTSTCLP